MSNDTAKRLLQAGLLAKVTEAPIPDPRTLPLNALRSERREQVEDAHLFSASSAVPSFRNVTNGRVGLQLAENCYPRTPSTEGILHLHFPENFALGSSKQTSNEESDSFDDLLDQLDFSPFEFDLNYDEALLLEKDAASLGDISLQRLLYILNTLSPLRDNI